MKALAVLLTMLCLPAFQAAGQSLAGHWTGTLPQDDKTYIFQLEVDLQQRGKRLSGQARLINNTGAWVVQRLEGEVNGPRVLLREVEVLKMTPFPNGAWCLKNFSGLISKKGGRLYINGSWSSSRVYDGKYAEGSCAPGKFSLSKPLPKPPAAPVARAQHPVPAQAAAVQDARLPGAALNEVFTLKNVLFVTTKDVLLVSSRPELDALARHLRKHPELRILVAGHTDQIGNAADNLRLSHQRAQAVKSYLAGQQIEPQRISTEGYGDTRPLCPPPCEANRRVEFTLLK